MQTEHKVCLFLMFFTIIYGTMLYGKECPCEIDNRTKTANCTKVYKQHVPDCVPRSVKTLIFTESELDIIYPRQFENFKELVNIDLSFAKIRYLSDEAFTGLPVLNTLDMTGNPLVVLNTTAFIRLSKLQILRLDLCRITEINENVFSGLMNLKKLWMDGNRIEYLHPRSFEGLSSLELLQINFLKLQSFPMDALHPLIKLESLLVGCLYSCRIYVDRQFKGFTSIKILKLLHWNLGEEGEGAELNFPMNLEQLEMFSCKLPAISNKTFSDLPLRTLYMQSCKIHVIYPFAFSSLKHLEHLSFFEMKNLCENGLHNITVGLYFTNIKYLDAEKICDVMWRLRATAIEGLQGTHLEVLNLRNSFIVSVEEDVFRKLPSSLILLNMSSNYMKARHNFYLSESLRNLYIDDNYIRLGEISDSAMNDEHKFKKQRISSDSNAKISVANNQETNTLFELSNKTLFDSYISDIIECPFLPSRLKIIDLSKSCLLPAFQSVLCSTYNSLKTFSASNLEPSYKSSITQEFWMTMKKMRLLEQLELSHNSIKKIPSDIFSEQTRLKEMSLSGNELLEVKLDIQKLFHLEILDLSDNRIAYIPSQLFQQIETIAKHSNITVFLHGNRLSCKCDQFDFVTWLLHTRVIFRKDNLTCEYQNDIELALSRISDIHMHLLADCFVLQIVLSSIVGFITLILTLSLVAIICHKRWRFKYVSLLARRNINPYHPTEDREILLEYDIYISYDRDHVVNSNETLHKLVTRTIYPSLRRRNLKVIIREELDMGKKLFDVISHALRRSRKVVVLLTSGYCKDHWNVFEFNTAVLEGIYTKRDVVIPVILETLKQRDLQEEVYAFLRSGPVAKFTFDRNASDLINFLFESAK